LHVPDGDGPWLGVLVFPDASAWTECELYDPAAAALAALAGDIAREHLSKDVELLVLPAGCRNCAAPLTCSDGERQR
jgi:hypothetical protein